MPKFLKVAQWEYMERIKRKSFIIMSFLMPAIMISFIVIPGLLAGKVPPQRTILGVIDETRQIFLSFEKSLNKNHHLDDDTPMFSLIEIDLQKGKGNAKEQASQLLKEKILQGYVVIPKTIFEDNTIEYYTYESSIDKANRLISTLEKIVIERRLQTYQIQPEEIEILTKPINLKSIHVKADDEEEINELEVVFVPMIFVMILFFSVFSSGGMLLRSVIEEKQNRIMEILLSSVTPKQLMAGKIIGLGVLGLTQLVVWLIIGSIFNITQSRNILTAENAGFFLAYFIMGYLLYASIFAMIGSLASSEQEAQQMTSLLSILAILPIVLAIVILENPHSLIATTLSFIPILTPTFMILRIAVSQPPPWEIMTSFVLLLLSIFYTIRLAGKVFEIGTLMYGKRPTLSEIWRWVKAD